MILTVFFSLFQTNLGVFTFDTVITQIGGVWNGVANNFLIPTKGMYFFHLTIMAWNGQGGVYIRRDTTDIQEAFAPSSTATGTAAVVLELESLTQMSAWLNRGQVHGRGPGPQSYCHFCSP